MTTVQVAGFGAVGSIQTTVQVAGVGVVGGPGGGVTSNAGLDLLVEPYAQGNLDGSGSSHPGTWTQTAGSPSVTVVTTSSTGAFYIAPATKAGTALTFQFEATNGVNTATDTTVHTIPPHQHWMRVAGTYIACRPFILIP
jgi:hypothetical protein